MWTLSHTSPNVVAAAAVIGAKVAGMQNVKKVNAEAAKIAECDFQIGFSAFLEWRQKAATPQNPQI
jgi:hypothetical protein